MIDIHFMRTHPSAEEPKQAYHGDAGWDLVIVEDTFLSSGQGYDVKTGVAVALPPDHYGRIVGRSSAMRKKGVLVIEGIIDCGFRGELFSYAYNMGSEDIVLRRGESIAQLIVSPIPSVQWVERTGLSESERGQHGFGSSGR